MVLTTDVQSLDLLTVACEDLRHAKKFQQLLNVILTMGNYLNGTNFAGGAYGFKIGSINKLVDTKSSNGQNLLHFLERTVSSHFPELDGFVDELQKPSEANRVSFADMQATSKQMLDEIRKIRRSLEDNFQDASDGYTRKMFRFAAAAEEDLQTVRDGILNAERGLRDVETYYGEGEEHGRPLQSQDFFGIFRTFTSSYKFCQQQNRARAEEQALREKRAAARAALTPQVTGVSQHNKDAETNLIDSRLQRLKLEGTPRIRREKRSATPMSSLPTAADFSDLLLPSVDAENVDYGSLAQKMMMNMLDDPSQLPEPSPEPTIVRRGHSRTASGSSVAESPTKATFSTDPVYLLSEAVNEEPENEKRAEAEYEDELAMVSPRLADDDDDAMSLHSAYSRQPSYTSHSRKSSAASVTSVHSRHTSITSVNSLSKSTRGPPSRSSQAATPSFGDDFRTSTPLSAQFTGSWSEALATGSNTEADIGGNDENRVDLNTPPGSPPVDTVVADGKALTLTPPEDDPNDDSYNFSLGSDTIVLSMPDDVDL